MADHETPNRSVSDRGLLCFDSLTDDYGARVDVIESSACQVEGSDRGPWVWIMVEGGGVARNRGAAHLGPAQARRVRDALNEWLAAVAPVQSSPDPVRVAKAIYLALPPGGDLDWESTKDAYLNAARAALGSVREPGPNVTEEMADRLAEHLYKRHFAGWDELPEANRLNLRAGARAALEAALEP